MEKNNWDNVYVEGVLDNSKKGNVDENAKIANHQDFQLAFYKYRMKQLQSEIEELEK
ncbi:MAG: hypothetical protein MR423_00750 [Firmicutes bacterium]|nr:hypothetical protein [Bacillota bacterium]MDY3658928.1 hypothetical protein [Eubacteriales bacterium]